MIKHSINWQCECKHCGKQWTTKNSDVPKVCPKCHRQKWTDDEPQNGLVEQVKALPVADRLALFESFELCCGMNRGACICEPEPVRTIPDDRQAKLAALRAMIAPIESTPVTVPVQSNEWIDDPDTFENGEILHWHHKPKCKPVCYARESDWASA